MYPSMKGWFNLIALTAGLLAIPIGLSAADYDPDNSDSIDAGKALPKPLSQPPPVFPSSLMRSGEDGVVMVSFTVDGEGRVRDPVVENSSFRALNPYALKAVNEWKFSPGTRNGRPAAFRLRAPVEFTGKSDGHPLAGNGASHRPAPALPTTAKAATPALSTPVAATPATTNNAVAATLTAPTAKRKLTPVYPYEMVINGQAGWADASFIVDYTGRPLFANPEGSSNRAFAMAVVAMVEANAYSPGRKGNSTVMSALKEHYEFPGDDSFDPEAKRVLNELRKQKPSILSSTDLDHRPKVIQQVSPSYPRALKDDGLTGQAEIEFIIDRDGRVLFPRIVSASHEDFGWAAATAVAQWKFQPPQKGGRSVEAKMSVPILFTAQKLAEAD